MVMKETDPSPRNYEKLLEQAISDSQPLTIFLLKGNPVNGRVIGYDSHTVLMESAPSQILIYKHSITTISLGKKSNK